MEATDSVTAVQQAGFFSSTHLFVGIIHLKREEEAEDRGTCGPSSQHTTRDPISTNRHDDGNSWLKLPRAMQWCALVGTAL